MIQLDRQISFPDGEVKAREEVKFSKREYDSTDNDRDSQH